MYESAEQRNLRGDADPVEKLAGAAKEITRGNAVPLPHLDRDDEIGVLARAMQTLQDAAAELEILVDQVPVGICRVDVQMRMPTVNLALAEMLGYTKEELTGRSILDINPPEHHARTAAAHHAFMTGKRDLYVSERQWVRKDGSQIWCSLRVAPIRPHPGGPPLYLIAIAEDITRQKHDALHAARIQHHLLPQDTPKLRGYDLAATCVPAENVGGDFYDWVVRDDGKVDLTLADVMGKGVGAALVMATVRGAMRATSSSARPVDRVRMARGSLSSRITDEGMFVTLFHCRLDTESGALQYVDAGHSLSAILRADGRFVQLTKRSTPLGVDEGPPIMEGSAQLDAGDTLILYSDGLVETEQGILPIEEFRSDFDSADAVGVVQRLLARAPEARSDDVTIVLLRRAL